MAKRPKKKKKKKISDNLEQLCSHINEKIGNTKKQNKTKQNTLSLRNCEIVVKKPTLKTTLNKIGDEVIVVNEFLNKLELEIEYQEQTNSSHKELCSQARGPTGAIAVGLRHSHSNTGSELHL
uniref:Uncharacterized protein n=1 Tax=Sus scrofa TaxID=9823 RepID=A0A8W4FGX9_PIG